ncbi:MAG: CBS domain-containing protein [Nitrososphaerales archaeon]
MPVTFGPAVRTRVLVREVMNSPVITAELYETILEISERMKATKVGSVVVMENDSPAGMVTESDIVTKAVCKDVRPSTIRAVDIVSRPLHMIESESEIISAARKMRKYGVKRLGVSYKMKLVGIISIADILAITPELLDIISEKARVITGGTLVQDTFLAGYCDVCNQWSDNLLDIDSKYICNECTSGKNTDEEPTLQGPD